MLPSDAVNGRPTVPPRAAGGTAAPTTIRREFGTKRCRDSRPDRLSEPEAGVSRPPAPREPKHSPPRNCQSHRLAVRAGEHSGPVLRAAAGDKLANTGANNQPGRPWTGLDLVEPE